MRLTLCYKTGTLRRRDYTYKIFSHHATTAAIMSPFFCFGKEHLIYLIPSYLECTTIALFILGSSTRRGRDDDPGNFEVGADSSSGIVLVSLAIVGRSKAGLLDESRMSQFPIEEDVDTKPIFFVSNIEYNRTDSPTRLYHHS